jgi:hypothetical protein
VAPRADEPDFSDPLFGDPGAPRQDARGFVGEVLRKAAVASLGALFMTEEGVRNLAGQLKLPKEMLGYLLAQAEKTKDDVGRIISEEVRRFLQSEKLRDEFVRLLAGMAVEVTAQIRLVPDPEGTERKKGAKHSVSVSVSDISAARRGKKKD